MRPFVFAGDRLGRWVDDVIDNLSKLADLGGELLDEALNPLSRTSPKKPPTLKGQTSQMATSKPAASLTIHSPVFPNPHSTITSPVQTNLHVPIVNAPKGVEANKAAGDAWERELINNELPKTQTQIQPQITVNSNGPSGKKVQLDAVGTDTGTTGAKLTDGKASATATLTPNQKVVYPELETDGGTVVGKGKPPYVGGTKIPPTKVDIIRKP